MRTYPSTWLCFSHEFVISNALCRYTNICYIVTPFPRFLPKCIHKPETRKKRLPSPFASFVRKKNKHCSFVVFPVSNHPPLIFVIIVVISAFSYFFSYSHIFTSAIVGIIKFLISRSSSSLITHHYYSSLESRARRSLSIYPCQSLFCTSSTFFSGLRSLLLSSITNDYLTIPES